MSMKTRSHHHAHHVETAHGHVETIGPTEQRVGDQERFQLIQVRAYEMWEHAGSPQGDDSRVRFWCDAEKQFADSYMGIG